MMGARRKKPTERKKSAAGKKRSAAAQKPKGVAIVIVGCGRVGGALALGLGSAGWTVSVFPRSDESVRRASSLNLRLADHDDLQSADLCLLAVPDAAVAQSAEQLAEDLGKHTALVHCSGALPLTVFSPNAGRRALGSFHPLAAVSDPRDDLSGHSVALSSTKKELGALLHQMAFDLRLRPLEVPETGRAAYHAGAVLSAGLVVALLDAAVSALVQGGIAREAGLSALVPLMRSALRGVELRGLEKGLTGPVVRGDVGVVQSHLDALPPEIGSVYRLLSRRALQLTTTLPAETRAALERLLL
jgi:predicted short-subunit dehydrogenase-like oxidoreductase (DUF2520 family)